jgi:hypothetical protein
MPRLALDADVIPQLVAGLEGEFCYLLFVGKRDRIAKRVCDLFIVSQKTMNAT